MTEENKPQGTAVAAPRKLDLSAIQATPVSGGAMFLPSSFQECLNFATVMAKSDFAIPPRFRGNVGACMAVTVQASRWQADPFGVIQKAYVTKSKGGDERLCYEAQLVAAIVNTRAPIHGRLSLTYSGEGHTRAVKVEGTFRDTGEVREVQTPKVGNIKIKNSPLWESDPDQQLAYYGMRAWGRRWVPEILLGIYTPEEMQAAEVIEAPRPVRQPEAARTPPADEGIVRQVEEETPIQAAETLEELIPPPPVEPEIIETPISVDDAQRVDETRVEPGPQHEVRADVQPEPVEDGPSEALERWVGYLGRAVEGLQEAELRTEDDFDDYGNRTKASLMAAEGLSDDEREDLRARFVSALLNVKRDRGFGRRRR